MDPAGTRKTLLTATGAGSICWLANAWLVADPIRHVLVQMPLLTAMGWLFMRCIEQRFARTRAAAYAAGGVAPLLLVFFIVIFWLLPRSIDAAINFRRCIP